MSADVKAQLAKGICQKILGTDDGFYRLQDRKRVTDEVTLVATEYLALQAENERLTGLHRKAVAEAAILLAEKTDRDEEIERLREALEAHRRQCTGWINFMDGHSEDCPACQALAQTKPYQVSIQDTGKP